MTASAISRMNRDKLQRRPSPGRVEPSVFRLVLAMRRCDSRFSIGRFARQQRLTFVPVEKSRIIWSLALAASPMVHADAGLQLARGIYSSSIHVSSSMTSGSDILCETKDAQPRSSQKEEILEVKGYIYNITNTPK